MTLSGSNDNKHLFFSPVFTRYIVPSVKNRKVLDVGCGVGQYLRHFSDQSIGMDLNDIKLKECKRAVIRGNVNHGLPFIDNCFEAVFCSHILEHLDAPINLLKEANRVLQSKGILIIAVPFEKSLVRLFLRDHYFKGHPHHLYGFTLANLDQFFKLTNFKHKKTFVEIPLVRRFNLWWVLSLVQDLPIQLTKWFAGNFYYIGEKYE